MGLIDRVLDKLGLVRKSREPSIPLSANTHPARIDGGAVEASPLEAGAIGDRTGRRVVLDESQRAAISAAISEHWDTQAILIHGGAGTGKSEVVKRIARKFRGRIIIVAPTGIAAHNVEGVTIHSQFKLPGAVLRFRDSSVIRPLGGDQREALRRAKLIVIDEISMVRADLLDAIDWSLRTSLEQLDVPFGGKRIVMVGDLLQLEPVADDDDLLELGTHWPDGHFFFDAHVWREARFCALELSTEHRQSSDQEFAQALRELRGGDTPALRARLNVLVNVAPEPDDCVILVTAKARAEEINNERLDRLPSSTHRYKHTKTGDFPPSERRAPDDLDLKVGARVLVTANAAGGPPYLFVNGTLGVVRVLNRESVTVLKDDGQLVTIGRHLWERKRYVKDPDSDGVRLQTVGTFSQIPLRLAWSMTVHKSQGLTFDKLHIDTTQWFFASGQGYVALTRCRTAKGLSVSSPIHAGMVSWKPRLRHFLDRLGGHHVWPESPRN
ncbi:MAG: AAA family ATPase [Armatimonadetes bacterium]|nr:AAA family ATPase [Armatimonadota bacterium]